MILRTYPGVCVSVWTDVVTTTVTDVVLKLYRCVVEIK